MPRSHCLYADYASLRDTASQIRQAIRHAIFTAFDIDVEASWLRFR